MSRELAISRAKAMLEHGRYEAVLAKRIAIPSVSQDPSRAGDLHDYLAQLATDITPIGFSSTIHPNPLPGGGPILLARRHEGHELPTVLCYGHADVVTGMEGQWTQGGSPWQLRRDESRLLGRGTADNKGQHTLLLLALEAAIAARSGSLGYNVLLLLDTCEETGSLGLREFCEQEPLLRSADLLIGSDGPRLSTDQPTFFLGTRGVFSFDLICALRDSGHHSGNWGGLLANPAVLLSHAIAALVSSDGRIQPKKLLPRHVPSSVRSALSSCRVEPGAGGPQIDTGWGEPGLSAAERLFGWTALEVLSMKSGAAGQPVNAIPPSAIAHCQIRYTVDCDPADFLPAICDRLSESGLNCVQAVHAPSRGAFPATRLDPSHALVEWACNSVHRTLGKHPSVIPNAAGTLPNDCFAVALGIPTLWIPHSYPGCRQHAPDEHLLLQLVDEGLAMMGGLFWDLGEPDATTWRHTQALEGAVK